MVENVMGQSLWKIEVERNKPRGDLKSTDGTDI